MGRSNNRKPKAAGSGKNAKLMPRNGHTFARRHKGRRCKGK